MSTPEREVAMSRLTEDTIFRHLASEPSPQEAARRKRVEGVLDGDPEVEQQILSEILGDNDHAMGEDN